MFKVVIAVMLLVFLCSAGLSSAADEKSYSSDISSTMAVVNSSTATTLDAMQIKPFIEFPPVIFNISDVTMPSNPLSINTPEFQPIMNSNIMSSQYNLEALCARPDFSSSLADRFNMKSSNNYYLVSPTKNTVDLQTRFNSNISPQLFSFQANRFNLEQYNKNE